MPDKPILFISHKHADEKIASVIRRFIISRSGGRVDVFQSSSYSGRVPQIGRSLNHELMKVLVEVGAVILVYTSADHDWSYCTWECGVAMDPSTPDTRIMVFQCGNRAPAVFADQVRVNIRNLVDIQKFAKEFLTSSDFFPGVKERIAPGFDENGPEVLEAAQQLYDDLQRLLPDLDEPTIEEWPAFPFIQLQISLDQVQRICDMKPDERIKLGSGIVLQHCWISDADRFAEQLFGFPNFPKELTLQKLVDKWKLDNPECRSKWIMALCNQVIDGAQWAFPKIIWELFPQIDTRVWYAPMLTRVRRSKSFMQFDIYFYKFYLDTEEGHVEVGVPSKE